MPDQFIDPVLILAGLAAALVAGFFLTFSDFVMRALGASAPAAGTEAMQHVNREVYKSVFMLLFLGYVPVALTILVLAISSVSTPASGWMIAGSISYLLGVFTVTALGNVPMNQRLDALDHHSDDGQAYWLIYHARWTRLNHVRTLCSIFTAASYLAAAFV
ncbi:MAG: DUF1772 domain-containing protein [Boseongicola sp.]